MDNSHFEGGSGAGAPSTQTTVHNSQPANSDVSPCVAARMKNRLARWMDDDSEPFPMPGTLEGRAALRIAIREVGLPPQMAEISAESGSVARKEENMTLGSGDGREAPVEASLAWGDPIVVDGKRPEWLDSSFSVLMRRKGSRVWVWRSRYGFNWNDFDAIRLPADHPYYLATSRGFTYWPGGDEAPADWDEDENTLRRNGIVSGSPVSWAHPWRRGMDTGLDVIGYRAKPAADEPFSLPDHDEFIAKLDGDDALTPRPEQQRETFAAVAATGRPSTVEIKAAIDGLDEIVPLNVQGEHIQEDADARDFAISIIDRLSVALISQDEALAEAEDALDLVGKLAVPLRDGEAAEAVQRARQWMDTRGDAPDLSANLMQELVAVIHKQGRELEAVKAEAFDRAGEYARRGTQLRHAREECGKLAGKLRTAEAENAQYRDTQFTYDDAARNRAAIYLMDTSGQTCGETVDQIAGALGLRRAGA